jgi:hypothetical protein
VLYNNTETQFDYGAVDEGLHIDFPNHGYSALGDEAYKTVRNDVTPTKSNVEAKLITELSVGTSLYYVSTFEHVPLVGTYEATRFGVTSYIRGNYPSGLPITYKTDITSAKEELV